MDKLVLNPKGELQFALCLGEMSRAFEEPGDQESGLGPFVHLRVRLALDNLIRIHDDESLQSLYSLIENKAFGQLSRHKFIMRVIKNTHRPDYPLTAIKPVVDSIGVDGEDVPVGASRQLLASDLPVGHKVWLYNEVIGGLTGRRVIRSPILMHLAF